MAAADSTDKLDTASMNKITRTVIRMIWNLPNITGIPSFENANFSIYPNPTNDYVTVKGLNTLSNGEYSIINLAGMELKKGKFQNTQDLKINLSGLSNGMYLIKIIDNKGQSIAINRLIKN
jgi:hypothetical protein